MFAWEDDLPPAFMGTRLEFDLVPADNGMFRAVNLKADENGDEV